MKKSDLHGMTSFQIRDSFPPAAAEQDPAVDADNAGRAPARGGHRPPHPLRDDRRQPMAGGGLGPRR